MWNLHDLEPILCTTTALVNTSPHAAGVEQLDDLAAVSQFIDEWIITEVETPSASDLIALHSLRRRLRAVFSAPNSNAKVALVNDLLMSAPIRPRLVARNGVDVHMDYFPLYGPLSDHLNADCAVALALVLASGEAARLRVCGAPDCSRVLVDSSRNRSRLYCDSGKCGNRMHSADYRARRRVSTTRLVG